MSHIISCNILILGSISLNLSISCFFVALAVAVGVSSLVAATSSVGLGSTSSAELCGSLELESGIRLEDTYS